MQVKVIGPKDKDKLPNNALLVYVVSRASGWSKGLSPFFLGPCRLYEGYVSKTVENAYQYCKVYKCHTDINGEPTKSYWDWAIKGWNNPKAIRYPMGKGSIPEYSLWDGKKLGYIDARKTIYIPLYFKAVKCSMAYKKLKELYNKEDVIYLWDFDAYDNEKLGMSFSDVLNCSERSLGHAFILASMLRQGI
ncbi:MAG: hypothetical protein WC523_00305 [Patescibacteria group bacterium]